MIWGISPDAETCLGERTSTDVCQKYWRIWIQPVTDLPHWWGFRRQCLSHVVNDKKWLNVVLFPLQQFTRTLTIVQERDAALKRLAEVEEEMEQMREDHKRELEQERQASKKELEKEREKSEIAKGQLMERLLREIAELRYEIGKLEEKSRENDEWFSL